mgnify:CR=1 FL=1
MDNKIPEHIGPPPMRPLRIEETPTEIAFQKAKEMKKMYLKHGGNGVVAYVKAAKRKEAQLKAEYDSKAIQASQ